MCPKVPRRSWFSSITGADVLGRADDRRAHVRLLGLLDRARVRHLGRVVHLDPLAVDRLHAVGDVRRRDQQVEVVLALEPLAHDVHVQQAEEAAPEAEPERPRRLRLVAQRRVVQLQLLERVAQLRVLVGVGREEAREHHRLHVLVAGQRLGRAAPELRERVADAQLRDVLEAGDDVAHLARREVPRRAHAGREEAQLLRPRSSCPGPSPAAARRGWKVPSTTRTNATTPRYWS